MTASRLINELRNVAPAGWVFDHIGSTAVPGLAAKPIVDLQIRVPTLPDDAWLDEVLGSVGYEPAEGSRPDSPGVYRDIPRGHETVSDDVWKKRLYVLADVDARPPSHLAHSPR